MPYTYTSYLRLDELLDLQTPASGGEEHDEMLFIVIHQVYELWFKQVLHEIDLLRRSFEAERPAPLALATLKRILTIFKTLVAQVDMLETMTPVSFLSFRDRLDTASGFQSVQFREIEVALGVAAAGDGGAHSGGERGARAGSSAARRAEPLRLVPALPRPRGYAVPDDGARAGRRERAGGGRAGAAGAGRDLPLRPGNREVCERWSTSTRGCRSGATATSRWCERTIGMKIGTGGSAGVEYLKNTLFKPLFPDLWAIRTAL